MADPTQVTGTPALNPPPPNDPAWLADTPATTDNYDVVIGNGSTTVGLLLYRGEDGGAPDKTYKTEAVDFQYAGTFVDRANVGSGYGDDQQSFWMTFVQKDWSGGIGQKYFRNQDPQSRGLWDCSGVDITSQPGSVHMGAVPALVSNGNTTATAGMLHQMVYYQNTVAAAKGTNALVDVFANTGTTVILSYSLDGGLSWSVQTTTAATKMHDLVDACVGENGQIYVLQAVDNTTATFSTISHIAGPLTAASLAWDNSTHISGSNFANCMCFWNGRGLTNPIYVGTVKGQLVQATMGSSATGTLIQDFGGGTIISLLATPKGIYVLYLSTTGEYKLFLYDGTSTTEVARLPKGWRYHYSLEQQLGLKSTFPAVYSTSHVMTYQDGVLYVGGLMPARDSLESQGDAYPLRTALWYYASGNSGIIWSSDKLQYNYLTSGGNGPIAAANGLIYFMDGPNANLMAYDPATQGVEVVADLYSTTMDPATVPVTTVSASTINTAPQSGTDFTNRFGTFTWNGTPSVLPYGTVLNNTTRGEGILIGPSAASPMQVAARAVTGAPALWATSDAAAVTQYPNAPYCALVFDYDHGVFALQGNNTTYHIDTAGYIDWQGKFTQIQLRNYLRPATTPTSWIATSLYDFDSSLPKYFRDVQWDGVLSQGLPTGFAEQAGTVDLYYKLDEVATIKSKAALDSGLVLIQTAAQPGTRYQINATAKAVTIVALLKYGGSSGNVSVGPIIRRLTVRAAPITPTYRTRTYEFSLFEDMKLKNGLSLEPRTPAQLRRNLETLISSNTPLTVSDAGVTSMAAMFDLSGTKIREMRPNEYVAYVTVREI